VRSKGLPRGGLAEISRITTLKIESKLTGQSEGISGRTLTNPRK
jgi:hypothetical protein